MKAKSSKVTDNKLLQWIYNLVAIIVDEVPNVALRGSRHETISGRSGRAIYFHNAKWPAHIGFWCAELLFFWQGEHCKAAYRPMVNPDDETWVWHDGKVKDESKEIGWMWKITHRILKWKKGKNRENG